MVTARSENGPYPKRSLPWQSVRASGGAQDLQQDVAVLVYSRELPRPGPRCRLRDVSRRVPGERMAVRTRVSRAALWIGAARLAVLDRAGDDEARDLACLASSGIGDRHHPSIILLLEHGGFSLHAIGRPVLDVVRRGGPAEQQ